MNKYLALSVLLHILVLYATMPKTPPAKKPPEQAKGFPQLEAQIVEVTPQAPDTKADTPKDYYWGIGMYSSVFPAGLLITSVAHGYCAEAAGLERNDLIVAINGKSLTPGNDIRGDGPRDMLLTIIRNKLTLYINVSRCKVYY